MTFGQKGDRLVLAVLLVGLSLFFAAVAFAERPDEESEAPRTTLPAAPMPAQSCPKWPEALGIALATTLFTMWNMHQGKRLKKVEKSTSRIILPLLIVTSALTANAQVHFSPGGDCRGAVVNAVQSATNKVSCQMYAFTDPFIAQAMTNAAHHRVAVTVIADASMLPASSNTLRFMRLHGVNVLVDSKHGIAHNKILIVDDKKVLTGSFNYSHAATARNAENLVELNSGIAPFVTNFVVHLNHSTPFLP